MVPLLKVVLRGGILLKARLRASAALGPASDQRGVSAGGASAEGASAQGVAALAQGVCGSGIVEDAIVEEASADADAAPDEGAAAGSASAQGAAAGSASAAAKLAADGAPAQGVSASQGVSANDDADADTAEGAATGILDSGPSFNMHPTRSVLIGDLGVAAGTASAAAVLAAGSASAAGVATSGVSAEGAAPSELCNYPGCTIKLAEGTLLECGTEGCHFKFHRCCGAEAGQLCAVCVDTSAATLAPDHGTGAAKDAAKAGHGVAKGAGSAGTGAAKAATGAAKGMQGDAKGNDKGNKTGRKTDLPQRYEVKRSVARANATKYEQAVQEQQAERRRSLKTPAGRSPSPRKNTNSTPWDVAVEKFLQNSGMLS